MNRDTAHPLKQIDMYSKTERGSYFRISDFLSSSVTINNLAMNARRVYCNFVDLSHSSLYQRLFNSFCFFSSNSERTSNELFVLPTIMYIVLLIV